MSWILLFLALFGWAITVVAWRRTLRDWRATILLCESMVKAVGTLTLLQQSDPTAEFLQRYVTSKRKMDD